jgi:hypothetical protein
MMSCTSLSVNIKVNDGKLLLLMRSIFVLTVYLTMSIVSNVYRNNERELYI